MPSFQVKRENTVSDDSMHLLLRRSVSSFIEMREEKEIIIKTVALSLSRCVEKCESKKEKLPREYVNTQH